MKKAKDSYIITFTAYEHFVRDQRPAILTEKKSLQHVQDKIIRGGHSEVSFSHPNVQNDGKII